MMRVDQLRPGMRIRVEQTVHRRTRDWTCAVEGTVVEAGPAPTGSWYAHGRGDKYWLRRIHLRKADGETSLLTIDAGSRITILPPLSSPG